MHPSTAASTVRARGAPPGASTASSPTPTWTPAAIGPSRTGRANVGGDLARSKNDRPHRRAHHLQAGGLAPFMMAPSDRGASLRGRPGGQRGDERLASRPPEARRYCSVEASMRRSVAAPYSMRGARPRRRARHAGFLDRCVLDSRDRDVFFGSDDHRPRAAADGREAPPAAARPPLSLLAARNPGRADAQKPHEHRKVTSECERLLHGALVRWFVSHSLRATSRPSSLREAE